MGTALASLAVLEPAVTPGPSPAPRLDIPARERLIVALDVPSVDAAKDLVDRLDDHVVFYKIGMQLQFAGGLQFAAELIQRGKKVFLDSKLFDIDETIELAVRNVAEMGVDFLTVHGNGKTIPAAVRGRGDSALKIFAVTVLTHLDRHDLADMYVEGAEVQAFVKDRTLKALAYGADGVIASGLEAAMIRGMVTDRLRVVDQSGDESQQVRDFHIVTPGIRMAGDEAGDQKRVATPRAAIEAGADYLVVGRPVTRATDPRAAADLIVAEIAGALVARAG